VPSICSDLLAYSQTGAIFLWAFETVKGKLCQELVALTDSDRHHFNASKTLSEYLEGSFMQIAAQKIKHSAPYYLWDLVYGMLDANPSHRRGCS
jgi:hypothetical protein